MEDFKKHDERIRVSGKNKLVKFAKEKGYKFFTEMVYDMHKNQNISARAITDFIFEETGRYYIANTTLYELIRYKGWYNKKCKYIPPTPRADVKKPRMCSCCGRKPVSKGYRMLCSNCHIQANNSSGILNEHRCAY